MTELIVVSLALLILIATYIYYRHQNYLPGPWNLPVIGYLHKIDPKVPHLSFLKLTQKYGPVYRVKLGLFNTVFISDVKLLKQVLMKEATISRPPLHLFEIIFGDKGIIYSSSDVWKDQRKFVSNFLRVSGATKMSPNKEALENQLKQSVQDFIQYVQNQRNPATLNPTEAVINYVTDITSSLILGTRNSKLVKILTHKVDKVIKQCQVTGPVNFLPFLRFLPKYRKGVKSIRDSMTEIFNIYDKIVCENEKTNNDNKLTNLVDTLILDKSVDKACSIDQLHILSNMFGASTETTITTIVWGLLYLAHFKEVQNKIRKELWDILQDKPPQIGDLPKLPYMEATLAEVTRIRSLFPLGFPHYTTDDVCVENVTIPKNTVIMPFLWAIHMDPKAWRNPEEFCPERFLNDEGKFYQPESFLPFQSGKRICAGKDVATMMVFMFVATVLQEFKLEGCNGSGSVDLSYDCGLTTTPKPQDLIFVKI
ncbi:cytochrome P450 306a1-like [Zophobas morio]|uniref:cytochrome P450 306a1-like n=1 Tax=Zophobas morio TaxID=2755281 RepID=UPI003082F1BC